MAYFYFVHKRIFKIAIDDSEKSKIFPDGIPNNTIEKIVTSEQFENFELNKFYYYLDDSDDLIEIENRESITNEESFTTEAVVIGNDTHSEKSLTGVINSYIQLISTYLINNADEQWTSFKELLSNLDLSTETYPLNKNIIQFLRDKGYTAYHILRLP
jgi:hypothetical protein